MWGVWLMILNYFHDLAVAIMAVNIAVVFFLGRYLDRRGADSAIMPDLFRKLTWVSLGALVFVIGLGVVRAYFFMDFEYNPAVGAGQVEALIIKHVILVALTLFGVIGLMKYRRKYG